jgi:hypothetical protein
MKDFALLFFLFLAVPFRRVGFGLSVDSLSINDSNECQPCSEINHFYYDKYFVMYYTDMIRSYSGYSFKINQFYGSIHNVGTILIDEMDDPSFDKEDVRWNKVKIIHNLLTNESHSVVEYFIWLDSDLFFVDMNYNISDLLVNYSTYDIIISREINPMNGIANTGSIIVKNSPWSKHFFHSWWYDYDHNSMDQHAFEVLYHNYDLSTVSCHVKLLNENEINSEFPGLWTFQNGFTVLHLAGESNFIREEVLKTAWNNLQLVNSSFSRSIMTREELDSVDYISLHFREWDSILQTLQMMSVTELVLEDLIRVRYRIREAQQSINKYALKLFHRSVNSFLLYNYTLTASRMVYGLSSQLILSTLSNSQPLLIPLLQNSLDSGMELAVVESEEKFYIQLLSEMKLLQVQIGAMIIEKDKKIASYYLFKIFEFEARFHQKHRLYERSLSSYQQALEVWFDLAIDHSYFGSGNALLSSYKEGINTMKNVLLLSCFSGIRNPKVDAVYMSFRGLCVLLRLIRKNQKVSLLATDSLLECSSDTFFVDGSSIFHHHVFSNFSDLSLLLQSEFIEIFLLSVHCPLYLPEHWHEWRQILRKNFNASYLASFKSYFDVASQDVVDSSVRKVFSHNLNHKGRRFKKKKLPVVSI